MKRKSEAHPKRAEALRLLERGKSPADVAAELDVPASTVRVWRYRATNRTPAAEQLPSDLEQLQRLAKATRSTAARALRNANAALDNGRAREAQAAMVAAGIALDKMGQLVAAVAAAEDRQRRLAHEQARELADRWNAALDALGIDRAAVAAVTRSALRGEPVSSEDASQARAAVRAQLGVAEVVEPEPARREPLALPPPKPPHPDGQERDKPEPMAGPRRAVRAVKESAQRRAEARSRPKPSKRRGQARVEEAKVRVGDRIDVFRFDSETGELLDPETPNWQ